MGTLLRYRSFLVILQTSCLVFLVFSGPVLPKNPVIGLFILGGTILGIWGVVSMRIKNLSIMPDIKPNSSLVKSGIYKYLRHPMYTSLFMIFIPLVIYEFTLIRLLVLFFLVMALLAKIYVEEYLLQEKYPEYKEYKKNTYRIIPFIF